MLTALARLMDERGGNCHAPQDLIADKAGCSRVTVSTSLKKAAEYGWLIITTLPKTNGTKGVYNSYIANIGR